jgi:hypothetical protein
LICHTVDHEPDKFDELMDILFEGLILLIVLILQCPQGLDLMPAGSQFGLYLTDLLFAHGEMMESSESQSNAASRRYRPPGESSRRTPLTTGTGPRTRFHSSLAFVPDAGEGTKGWETIGG